jgi:hypothetical protein
MRLIKLSNSREKEESAFARSKTLISYKLEEDKQKECLETADYLPLLVSSKDSESSGSAISQTPLKSKVSKKNYFFITDSSRDDIETNSVSTRSVRKNRLKLRDLLFLGSSSKKKKKSHSRHPSDLDTIPIISFSSRDTESQADDEEKRSCGENYELVATVNSSDDYKIDLFHETAHAVGVDSTSRQQDLNNFCTKENTTIREKSPNKDAVNVLNELACMESSRFCEKQPDTRNEETEYHALVSSVVSMRMRKPPKTLEDEPHQERDRKSPKTLEDEPHQERDRKSPNTLEDEPHRERDRKSPNTLEDEPHRERDCSQQTFDHVQHIRRERDRKSTNTLVDEPHQERDRLQQTSDHVQHIHTIRTRDSHDDDETVVTVKCSNCSIKQINPTTRQEPFPESNQTPKIRNARPKDNRRKCKQALTVSFHEQVL